MNGKIIIRTELKVLTGLHIGAAGAFSAIGAIDSSVVRDKRTQRPIIPGSSLKGKLRTLLVRSLVATPGDPATDPDEIKRLFGSIKPKVMTSRLQFADAFMKNAADYKNLSDMTEAKMENTINRVNMQATPRTIERVVSGAVFEVCIAYSEENPSETLADLKLLAHGMRLLQIDYLGGHGTRGDGRVSFENIRLEKVDTDTDIAEPEAAFREVEKYELLSV